MKVPLKLLEELILKWLKDGAIPSDSVKSLFKRIGLSYKWHLMNEGKSEQEIKKLLEKWLADEEERKKRKKDKKLAKKAASKKSEDIEVSSIISWSVIDGTQIGMGL